MTQDRQVIFGATKKSCRTFLIPYSVEDRSAFVSGNTYIMEEFKFDLKASGDTRTYEKLTVFIRWIIHQYQTAIFTNQK